MKTRLKEIRLAKGMTQTELADASSVGRVMINLIENEKNVNLTWNTMAALAHALDKKVSDIFFEDDV